MSQTKIEWATKVWNPVTGCTKVSPGCQNCYAERMAKRLAGRCGYLKEEPFKVTVHPERLEEPLNWKKPQRIFVCSMGDLFHDDVPDEFIGEVFNTMVNAQWILGHRFLVLTKRPERMKRVIEEIGDIITEQRKPKKMPDGTTRHTMTFSFPLQNIWLGVTAENQEKADERIPILLQIPAAKRFVSVEPMLGPVDLRPWIRRYYHGGKPRMKEGAYLLPPSKTGKSTLLQYAKQIDPNCVQRADRVYLTTDYMSARMFAMGYPNGEAYRAIPDLPLEDDPDCTEKGLSFQTPQARITSMSAPVLDWVIAGGESGPGARPMHPDWARSLRDQCQASGTPFFFKQWGEWLPNDQEYNCDPGGNDFEQRHQMVGDVAMCRVGKKKAGRLLDGRTWDEFPKGAGLC
jgi:protein gp37